MNSSGKTSEVPEEDKMDASNSAEENEDKAGRLTEVSNLGAAENACPEKTLEVTEEDKMDASNSAEENKDKAEEQPKMSNNQATPSLINQAENTPADILTSVETSEPKIKKTKQNNESGEGTKGSWAKKLMKCPKCKAEVAPSVTFCKQKNDEYEFDIGLYQDNGHDHTVFFKDKLDRTNQAAVTNNKIQCPNCEHSFPVNSVARTNKMGGFDIELSINIPKKKLEQAVETSSATANSLGMDQDDGDDSSSEKSSGSNTADPTAWSRLRDGFSNLTDKLSAPKKPEQSSQTTDSKGWSLPNIFMSPTPVLKVHYTSTNDTFGADTDIMKQLKNNLKSSVLLEETTRKNCSIIILFCPVSRSFESEVKSAMEKEAASSCGKRFILVLMHYTRDPYYSTAGCDASEVLKNVFYVHVFYHESANGLLKWPQNAQAIKVIEDVLLHKK